MARYQDLLDALPSGSAYATQGYVLPFRDAPQEFLFEDASYPTQKYGLFVNDKFFGEFVSDATGALIVKAVLDPGEHAIVVENDTTARRMTAYVTVRDYAVWFAAYAEAFEGTSSFFGIDPGIDSVQAGIALSTTDNIHIEGAHGRVVAQSNNLGFTTDAFRNTLQTLRQAFRLYGGARMGVEHVAAAFTNSRAFVVPKALRPTWYLGTQYAPELDQRTHVVTSTLPRLNQVSRFESTLNSTQGSVAFPPEIGFGRIAVTFPSTWDGGVITVVGTRGAGVVVSEGFTLAGPAIDGYHTVQGTEHFSTITSISNGTIGSDTADAGIGPSDIPFIKVVEIEGSPIPDGAASAPPTYLVYNNISGTLSLSFGGNSTGANDNRVLLPASGRYTVPYNAIGDLLLSVPEPSGGWDLSDGSGDPGLCMLYFECSDRGLIAIELGLTGAITGLMVNDLVTDINAALTADTRYGVGCAELLPSSTGVGGPSLVLKSDKMPYVGKTQQGYLRLRSGPADASRALFGIPRNVGDISGAGTAGDTSIVYTAGDSIGAIEAPFTARVGRGRLLSSGSSGAVSSSAGGTCVFTATGLTLAVGDAVRILPLGTGQGIHEVIEVVSATSWRLRHQTPGGFFTDNPSLAFSAWCGGDLVDVLTSTPATQTLTLAAPGLPRDLPSNYQVELESELPYQTDADQRVAPANLVIDVDLTRAPTVSPGSNISENLTIQGQLTPDGWLVRSPTTNQCVKSRGLSSASSMGLERGASDIQIEADIPGIDATYQGFNTRVSFWVLQHNDDTSPQNFRIDVSWDGGASYVPGATTAVTGSIELDGVERLHRPQDAQLVTHDFTIPRTATGMRVRLTHFGTSAGDRITVERCLVTRSTLFLGQNTIVRDASSASFSEIVYLWSPDDLDNTENKTLGLPSHPDGKLDQIQNAHGLLERFDVSEYDSTTQAAVNLVGAYDDSDWAAATVSNMTLVSEVPGRLSYLKPSRISRVENEVLSPSAFGVASLANTSAHIDTFPQNPNGTARLFENSIPVPDTVDASGTQPYVFTAANQIDIDNGLFDSNKTYTLDYDVSLTAETAVINLGTSHTDYLWLIDGYVWQRIQQTEGTRTVTQELTLRGDNTAPLKLPSDEIKDSATLFQDNGSTREIVPETEWNFVNATVVQLNSNIVDVNSIYELEYAARHVSFDRRPAFTLELRSAVSQAAVPGASYSAVKFGQALDNTLQFHQLRIQLHDVHNIEDIRVHSLGVRGLNAFGTPPNAPGIILP